MTERAPIRRLAVVNRGEAALRCIRTVKALRAREGTPLEVVALYTEVDRDAPFVRHADRAVALPAAATPVAAYLDHRALLDVLRGVGADASGPAGASSPRTRRSSRGSKRPASASSARRRRDARARGQITSKRLAESAGVPVSPWSGDAVDVAERRPSTRPGSVSRCS